MFSPKGLFLSDCIGISSISNVLHDALSDAGMPSISSVYGNLNTPSSLNDIGGSAASKADTLNSGVNNAFGTYMDYAKSLPQPLQIYNQLEQQNGIPQLRSTTGNLIGDVNNLQQTIDRVEPNVNQNTTNSLATESQREGMVAAQKYPLQQQLTPEMNALATTQAQLGNAESNVGTITGLVNQGNQQMLNVAGMGVTVAQDNAARTMSGFTSDQQNTMNMLFKKLDIQKGLDDAEWNTLSMLAGKKQDYNNALGQITAQAKANNTQPSQIGANGSMYFNAQGQPVLVGGGNSPTSQGAIGGHTYSIVK